MKTLIATAVLALAIVGAANGAYTNGDPRKCTTNTGTDPSKHAFYCAQAAAVTVTRTKIAALQHVSRWFPGVTCSQATSLLKWRCVTSSGGKTWTATVAFQATAAGWRHTVTVR